MEGFKIISEEAVIQLTGYLQKNKQIEWLSNRLGIPKEEMVNARNEINLLECFVIERLYSNYTLGKVKQGVKDEPIINWDMIN